MVGIYFQLIISKKHDSYIYEFVQYMEMRHYIIHIYICLGIYKQKYLKFLRWNTDL